MKPEALKAFIAEHWRGDEKAWLEALSRQKLLTFDWPVPWGDNWSRAEQLAFIRQLAVAGCPLFPDSLTVIAPIIMNLAGESLRDTWLLDIRTSPGRWGFNRPATCSLQLTDETLRIVTPDGETVIGNPGFADQHLADCFSAAHLLYEHLVSVEHLRRVAKHWSEDQVTLSEWDATTSGLEALFLRGTPRHDRQLALQVEASRVSRFSTLFSLLGYYALLDPDPVLSGNEPLPFSSERRHLGALQRLQDRDSRLQKDSLFNDYLAEETDS